MLLSDFCLTYVAYIGPNSRTERPRKTKIGTDVAHVARTWLGHHFQGQKVKGQLVADVLNSQHAGTGAAWRMNTKILSTCRGRRHIVAAARLQLVNSTLLTTASTELRCNKYFLWSDEYNVLFTRATLASAVLAIQRWLSVRLSVCHTPLLCING